MITNAQYYANLARTLEGLGRRISKHLALSDAVLYAVKGHPLGTDLHNDALTVSAALASVEYDLVYPIEVYRAFSDPDLSEDQYSDCMEFGPEAEQQLFDSAVHAFNSTDTNSRVPVPRRALQEVINLLWSRY